MRKGLLVETKYCSGCHSCEVACRNEHGFSPDQFGIKVNEVGPFVVDEATDHYVWNYTPVVTELCDLCGHRVAKGEKPACVHHCLADAIHYGSLDELSEEMDRMGSNAYVMIP